MTNIKDDTKNIRTQSASNPQAALVNARERSAQALSDYPEFFSSSHLKRVKSAETILGDFFQIRKGMYVNHRANRGQPFSVVKVDGVRWDAHMQKHKQQKYLKPIQDLGGEIVYAKGTNSVLVRIRK